MSVNTLKVGIAGVVALACVVALILDDTANSWAVPVLMLVVGYVVGNGQVTDRTGNSAPIVSNRGT